MKSFLLLLATLFCTATSFSQSDRSSAGTIGCLCKVSADNQYVKIINIHEGSPADMWGLRAGDHINRIDDINVKEIRNPVGRIAGAPGTYVKLNISRYGNAKTGDVTVPRISVSLFNENNYVSEGELTSRIYTNDYSDHSNMVQSSMTVLDDEEADIYKYKTYDFDYTSAADPLLEKEIFKVLGDKLNSMGLRRSQVDPGILIVMNSYSGQKEYYNPPQQIISTHISTTYDWYWGFVPVPITESTTTKGYTDVTYLYTISLKFLDAHKIGTSKVPPVIWSGSVSQASKSKTSMMDKCDDLFTLLLYQFPVVWFPNSEYYLFLHYTYTGIIYNLNEMRTIAEVIPGSPAAIAGIQKGDEIANIYNSKIPDRYADASPNQWSYLLDGKNNGLRYLFILANLVYKPYMQKDLKTVSFVVKRNGKRMKIKVTPEDKTIFTLRKD
ncbi:MAG: PDZ domain-containing protein [Bacteroidetes bacterium]|nr:PDZ domain-containing protein [Bacteroidota bacterium]